MLQILDGVFDLLREVLPNVSEKVRQDSKNTMVKIVDVIKKLIPTAESKALLPAALSALKSIADTLSPGEEHALTATVPLTIKAIRERRATASALSTLLSLMCVII